MEIRKRPSTKSKLTNLGQDKSGQLQNLAILMAEFMAQLNEALSLLEGACCFRNAQLQLAAVGTALEEPMVWFSDYFEDRITEKTLLMNLQTEGAPAFLDELNYLGVSDDDDADLVGPLSELDDFSVPRARAYPPGVSSSILDVVDEDVDTGGSAKLFLLEQDFALISKRIVERIRVAGFKLHGEFTEHTNGL